MELIILIILDKKILLKINDLIKFMIKRSSKKILYSIILIFYNIFNIAFKIILFNKSIE